MRWDFHVDNWVHILKLSDTRIGRAICDWYECRLTGWTREELAEHDKGFHG